MLPPIFTIFRRRSLTESSCTEPMRPQPWVSPASVVSRTRAIANCGPWEGDQDAKIDTCITLQGDERAEGHFRICFSINGNDHTAAPP